MVIILNRRTLKCLQRYNDGTLITKILNIDLLAEYGHLSLICYYNNDSNVICTTDAIDFAANSGHLNIIKWLHTNRTEGCTRSAIDYAAFNGYLDIIKWLYEYCADGCTMDAIYWAAESGYYDIAEFLYENRHKYCNDCWIGYEFREMINTEIKFALKNNNIARYDSLCRLRIICQ
jgi:hypothetical protein